MIKAAKAKFNYSEITGEIIGFKKSFDFDDNTKVVGYTPIVKFMVNGKEYSGQPIYSQVWSKPDYRRKVIVLYDSQNPKIFSLKDNGLIAGCLFLVFSIVGIIIILALDLS